jgi:hypothetical protein
MSLEGSAKNRGLLVQPPGTSDEVAAPNKRISAAYDRDDRLW